MSLLVNKTARLNYHILDEYEAGISLAGFEVKSLRDGQGSLREAYVKYIGDELYLTKAFLPPFQRGHAMFESYDPNHPRKLLLKKRELSEIRAKLKEKGLTLIPLSLYLKGNRIKASIALARGKKLHDKRQTLKDKTSKREAERAIKNEN